jgi:hypothetical protein
MTQSSLAMRAGAGLACWLAALIATTPAPANDFAAPLARLVEERIRPWLNDPALVQTLRQQNAAHAGLSQEEIDRLDSEWRSQAKAGHGPLIESVAATPASRFLVEQRQRSDGLFSELFVMDARGLTAGHSEPTSDYWQGDEAKWQRTYAVGPQAQFIDEIEFDESSQSFQSQVSVTVPDPETGAPLGAITVGVNVEKLLP